MTTRAVVYARVSTDEQAEHGHSLPTQLEARRKYAAEHGHVVAAEVTDDFSGARLNRPGLDRVRAMLKRREAEAAQSPNDRDVVEFAQMVSRASQISGW